MDRDRTNSLHQGTNKDIDLPPERPWFKTIPKRSVDVAKAQGTTLHCDAGGDPPPELEWRKNGVPLKTTMQIAFHNNKKELILQHLRKEDSGLFECEARNTEGKVTTVTSLRVVGMDYCL